jgi:hypothetical protein
VAVPHKWGIAAQRSGAESGDSPFGTEIERLPEEGEEEREIVGGTEREEEEVEEDWAIDDGGGVEGADDVLSVFCMSFATF